MKSPEQFGTPIDEPRAEKKKEFPEDIKKYIDYCMETKQFDAVYKLHKQYGVGTPEEIAAVGRRAYDRAMEVDMFNTAMKLAEDLYGKDSDEWRRAYEVMDRVRQSMQKAASAHKPKEAGEHFSKEQDLSLSLSKDATFADLFKAIDEIEKKEGEGAVHFEDELADNFDENIAEEILAFRNIGDTGAESTKIVDFFKKRGFLQKDITTLLPIKFKRGPKVKK